MNNEKRDETVLVTGGSGFVGAHCVLRLLKEGYRVKTTVRARKRETDVRQMLKNGGIETGDGLSFAVADLLADDGWNEAAQGCDYVLHVASPFPAAAPKHEDELIIPAREGTLRVLKAARNNGVRRVVLTSSFAAIGYAAKSTAATFTEKDWTDPNGNVSAYVKSKTLAELAAWDFAANEKNSPELAVINPVGIFGPVLGADQSTSTWLIQRMLSGGVPRVPPLSFGVVDVRDLADLHFKAMISPQAAGERFLAAAGDFMTMPEIAALLKNRLGSDAARVSTKPLPVWLARLAGLFSKEIKQILPELGKIKNASHEKAVRILDWSPRSNEDAIVATAESLLKLGLVKN